MSINPKIADLMKIVGDSSVSIIDRRAVAEHVVQLAIDAVPEPADDDSEVVTLRKNYCKPWSDALADSFRKAWNEKLKWPANDGPTLTQARAHIQDRRRVQAVLAIIADGSQPHVLRESACARILADHPQIAKWRMNNYDAARLLSEVLAPDAVKFGGLFKPDIPVERPPKSFADLWRL